MVYNNLLDGYLKRYLKRHLIESVTSVSMLELRGFLLALLS